MNQIQGYTTVCYPESMPEDWQERLELLPFGYCYSTHDKDTKKDEDGTEKAKKAHIHVFFQGKCSSRQKQYIHASLGVGYGEDVRSAQGMYEYLTHENNPDKFHYDKDSIHYSPKWNQELFESHIVPYQDCTARIIEIIYENNITEYCDLIDCLVNMNEPNLLKQSKALWVMRFIDSRRNTLTKMRNTAATGQKE